MMVKMITSWKMRPIWWLLLTWLIGTRSASIIPLSFPHGRALQIMRRMISPSNMMLPARRRDHLDSSIGAHP